MSTFNAAVVSAKATLELLSIAIKARDQVKIEESISTLRQELLEALTIAYSNVQTANTLELEAQKLRTQLLEAELKQHELEREIERRRAYKLAQPAKGAWAYVLENALAGAPDSTTYFCPACHAEKRDVPMQFRQAAPSIPNRLVCPLNKEHVISLGGALPAQTLQVRGLAGSA
ncbi:MAG: hypothetical protein LBE61_09545 [Burkholderiaceae bacterium]|jgi:hypothetical protein|nr:hypothetical protein [Burkholderiaceae bacterium]